MHMLYGKSVREAVRLALEDADCLPDAYATGLNVLALDCHGNHAAASNREGTYYVWISDQVDSPQEEQRLLVGVDPAASPAPH